MTYFYDKMSSTTNVEMFKPTCRLPSVRSHSVQGLAVSISSPTLNIPLPPKTWFTDVSNESSEDDENVERDNEVKIMERSKVRARYRHHTRLVTTVPIGIFWDIENCQVPKGCSAIDVVSAIRAKFLPGRREADFVVVCDVRKETAHRLQELNDAQISLIHVCGTQKNAADEKLRQCMRRYGEIHSAPAALLLISGDINFAADLSDFRHRKGLEVILVHNQNTSNALIACASSHYCFIDLTSQLPRNTKQVSVYEGDDEPACMVAVMNLPTDQPPTRVAKRLRRLADNCGGRVKHISANMASMKFPTPDHATRAAIRMDGEDVFGHKIGTRYSPNGCLLLPATSYSSDEGYSTASVAANVGEQLMKQEQTSAEVAMATSSTICEWSLALQQLPTPTLPPLEFCPPPALKPRQIRGTHGSNLDRSGCSSSNSGGRETSQSRAISPWNSSTSFSSEGELESMTEITVSNLPEMDTKYIQTMLTHIFGQHVPVVKITVCDSPEGPLATVVLQSEWDARIAIAHIHKRRPDKLELSFEKPSPASNLDVLRARLRAILLDQHNYTLPLLRLRDIYSGRHCCALTTSDIAKITDTVVIHEGPRRMVQLIDITSISSANAEDAPWKCHVHAAVDINLEDSSRNLQPVYIEDSILARNTQILLDRHGGILPLLSFVECYEATFPPLELDFDKGVPLELLLRNVPGVVIQESPCRHMVWRVGDPEGHAGGGRWCGAPRTAPALEPMLALLERELLGMLRVAPRCIIEFNKLIPTYNHHFGRQCRVADYGFTKLPDLLAALSNTIVLLGSGSSRLITISAAAQSRRWTTDLVKMLKSQPGRPIYPQDIPQLYQTIIAQNFSPADYGVCTLEELMQRVNPQAVIRNPEGSVSLPRRTPTPDERARIVFFSVQATELLCNTPNLRMELPRFVSAYHSHFGRQLRVADYGCVKLVELLEMISDEVTVSVEEDGEKIVRLNPQTIRKVMGQRLRSIAPVPLDKFPIVYAVRYGGAPLANTLNMNSLEELVFAAGGCVEDGIIRAPGSAPHWVSAILAACTILSADRSIARGSTKEFFTSTFRRMFGVDPELNHLMAAGVITVSDKIIRLMPAWRTVWRVTQILADSKWPLNPKEICVEYSKRYEPAFPCVELGFESLVEFLQYYREVFICVAADEHWTLATGVSVTRCAHPQPEEYYSLFDTPPGQKGSRVFESPRHFLLSPPACALPTPAFLNNGNKRRTNLAAQFNAF